MRMETTLAWAAAEPSVGGLGTSWYVLEICLLAPAVMFFCFKDECFPVHCSCTDWLLAAYISNNLSL